MTTLPLLSLFHTQESSVIHSNANLGVHGQGLLNLSGAGDKIQAQRLVLSLFYSIHVSDYFIVIIDWLFLVQSLEILLACEFLILYG